jgi:hypothetical protein
VLEHAGGTAMNACGIVGCGKAAVYKPVLSFTALVAPNGARVELVFGGIFFCAEHATPEQVRVVGDEGWQQIEQALAAAGRSAPDRESLRVRYIPIK